MGRTWNRGLLFQSEDNVEVIRGNGRQVSNAAYSKRSGIVVSRTIPQISITISAFTAIAKAFSEIVCCR